MIQKKRVCSFLILLVLTLSAQSQTTIINYSSSWKYLDNNTRPVGWESVSFDDSGWQAGNAELGYGDGDEATVVSFGGNSSNKYITTLFRKVFTITDLNSFANLTFNIVRDDGFVLYLNGVELLRNNLPHGAVNNATLALSAISGSGETTPLSFVLCPAKFLEGENAIAVEMHQNAVTSSDISFRLQLTGNLPAGGTPQLTRGPYLQMGGETAITLRWRTNIATNSRVEVGTVHGAYGIVVDSLCHTTEHEVRVSGLSPDTKYFYRIGTTTSAIQGGTDNFFKTVHGAASNRKTMVAAFGDCGGGNIAYQTDSYAQYLDFLESENIEAADAWILLGDNAYDNGTDQEFTDGFFIPFTSISKNHKLYPSPGNHDYAQSPARQDDHDIPYYSIFNLPTNGECGGLPSGTEAYYSFDIGNIHFISLDSYGEENNRRFYDTTAPQAIWLKADLAANTKKWVVAYWHHPPYTMGSHNSDTETELILTRTNLIRILERLGVDLILCGHSHDYERSKLIGGHYGNELTYSEAVHAKSTSSGNYTSGTSCPYVTRSGTSDHGTVYVVSGSFGASGGVKAGYPHNAMPYSINDAGFFWFEADENRLDAKFIQRNGDVWDRFTIMQDINSNTTYNIAPGDGITLTASWPGNYNWSTTETTRSVQVNTTGTEVYYVTDNFSCNRDTFTVNATCGVNTWVGGKSDAWENAGNWSCGTVPGPNSEVIVNTGTLFNPKVNSNISIRRLTLNTGATVVVVEGFKIDITGTL